MLQKSLELFWMLFWISFKPFAVFCGISLLTKWISKGRIVSWNIDALSEKILVDRSDWKSSMIYIFELGLGWVAWKFYYGEMKFDGPPHLVRDLFYKGMIFSGPLFAYFCNPKVSFRQYANQFLGFTALAIPRAMIAIWLYLSFLMLVLILDREFKTHYPVVADCADFLADFPVYAVWFAVLWIGIGKVRRKAVNYPPAVHIPKA